MLYRIAWGIIMQQRSAWEKLTQGMCNAPLVGKAARPAMTAREVKDQARAAVGRVTQRFAKLDALNLEGAEGRRAKKKLNESWFNRGGNNVTGFYNQRNANEFPA